MEFDDIMKKRIMELEEFLRKMLENSDKFTEIREYLSNNGYNAVLCLMTMIYRPEDNFPMPFEDEFFEEEIDEELEEEFNVTICDNDKLFFKKIQDELDY
ncbi:MAG: hypothetical protein RBU23_08350 [Candidatus Auribacterota bacterium]|jgi:hypothetical protein|nr:hypothetical protein [Candidatus Auribacterota bacterium]